jgi:hypothetical protein
LPFLFLGKKTIKVFDLKPERARIFVFDFHVKIINKFENECFLKLKQKIIELVLHFSSLFRVQTSPLIYSVYVAFGLW